MLNGAQSLGRGAGMFAHFTATCAQLDHTRASWWSVSKLDRKAERIVVLKNMQLDGWFALAPNNSLITPRLASSQSDLCSRLESAMTFADLPVPLP
jgi:hypothetical protein